MEKYESKQHQICRSAEQIYTLLSNFSNFTPVLQDKLEEWTATEDYCSFKVKGVTVRLHMAEKVPFEYVKVSGDDKSPIDFTFWIQLKQIDAYDTRMRMVLHAKLNTVMKMMVGSKIQHGLDEIAGQVAKAFNGQL